MGLADHLASIFATLRRAGSSMCRGGAVLLALLVLCAGAGVLQPPVAVAATEVSPDFNPGGLVVEDLTGDKNVMKVRAERASPGSSVDLIFEDTSAELTVSAPGCTGVTTHLIRCDSALFLAVTARLNGGNDEFRLEDSTLTVASIANVSIDGGAGNDTLESGAGRQVILGGADDDTLTAGDGNDSVLGLHGKDVAHGGPGRDELEGGGGNDELHGDDGADVVSGQDGDDVVDGGGGDDETNGGDGADDVRGGDGADRLEGPDITDPTKSVARGPDKIAGGPGNDRIGAGPQTDPLNADAFSGGDGQDAVEYSMRRSPLRVVLDGSPNDGDAQGEGDNVQPDVERLVGGTDNDILVGSNASEVLDGGPDDDVLLGEGGADTLVGGVNDPGNDTLVGGEGVDTLLGGAGDDGLAGGPGDDSLSGEGGTDTLVGEGGRDFLAGGPGLDDVRGGEGDDKLYGGDLLLVGSDGKDNLDGGPGNDELNGGDGDDRLDGGLGADRMSGGAGSDTVSYETRARPVTVTFDDRPNDGEEGEGDNVASDIEIVLGGRGADTLFGNDRFNELSGARGEDLVTGENGPDLLEGGERGDVLRARDGSGDTLSCGDGGDLAIVDKSETKLEDCEYVDRPGASPVLARRAVVTRVKGFELQLPAGERFFPLTGAVQIPFGSTVDAKPGAVRLATVSTRAGARQEMSVSKGLFSVRQRRADGAPAELALKGGDFNPCGPREARALSNAAAKRPIRRLLVQVSHRRARQNAGASRRRGKPKRYAPVVPPGGVHVRGRGSDASSIGTTWLTEDRCDGTLTRVVSGTVRVRDFGRHTTVKVRPGKTYLARR